MHKCIVCFNMYKDTKVNRPEVIYHGFPKNAYMRRKWLKVFGIDRCHDWQRVCSDHFLEKNYRPGKSDLYFQILTKTEPYDRNGFPSNYATQSNGVETGNNIILPMEQNITREEHIGNAVVNSFKSPKQSYRFTGNNVDMRSRQMPDHTLGSGLQCSVKNCMNRLSKNLSLFGYPKDITLRKLWIRKCGIKTDATKIALSSTRVCSIHFEPGCFKNPELKNRLKRGSVPSLFLDNEPCALPVPIIEVPVLSTCDTLVNSPIVNEAAEQSSSEIKNNVKDNTDITSMVIDLTIDDSSNSSLSITLEPIEERTSQCIMDVCKTNNNTRNEQGLIYKISKEVVLPNLYWKCEHLKTENATRFYQQDTSDVTVKKVNFCNNLVPTIEIYGKKYDYKTPITTKKELEDLLEEIDSILKCYGRGGFVFDQCIGYFFENSSVDMCSGCEGLVKDQDLQRIKAKIEARNKTMESFKNRIAEKEEIVLNLRKAMAESKRNRQLQLALKPSGI